MSYKRPSAGPDQEAVKQPPITQGVARRGFLRRAMTAGIAVVLGQPLLKLVVGGRGKSIGEVRHAEAAPPSTAGQSTGCAGGTCLSATEFSILEAMTEVVIPSDASGAGAKAAGVAQRIQEMMANMPVVRQRYSEGLAAFDTMARSRYGAGYAALSFERQRELFAYVEEVKGRLWPDSPPETFMGKVVWKFHGQYYRRVVGMTDAPMILIDQLVRDSSEAFYASAVAWESLGYSGPPFPFGYAGRRSHCSQLTS